MLPTRHGDNRPARTRKLIMLTPTCLTTTKSEKCPGADHALFYHKTCHNLHSLRTLGFEDISMLCPPLPSRGIKLSLSTSPKILSPKFVLAPVNREAELFVSVIWSIWIFVQNLSQLRMHPVIFSPTHFLCIFLFKARYARCKLKYWNTGPRSQPVAIWMLQNSLFQ